jgi:hypothetical protein
MKTANEASEGECVNAQLPGDDVIAKSKVLYFILAQSCQSKPLDISKRVWQIERLLAWRRLSDAYKPNIGGRPNSMLAGLLAPDAFKNETFEEAIYHWEVNVNAYERQKGEDLADRQRVVVIAKALPPDLRLTARLATTSAAGSYGVYRQPLIDYAVSTIYQMGCAWQAQSESSAKDDGGVRPVGIGDVGKRSLTGRAGAVARRATSARFPQAKPKGCAKGPGLRQEGQRGRVQGQGQRQQQQQQQKLCGLIQRLRETGPRSQGL